MDLLYPLQVQSFFGGNGEEKEKNREAQTKKGTGIPIRQHADDTGSGSFILDIDTDDFMLNAWLVPAFSFINSENIQMRVNFHGTSSLVLDLRTRLGLLLWTVIRNKYRSFF